jgi:flagellar motility protein MotE (MotC chaperone)
MSSFLLAWALLLQAADAGAASTAVAVKGSPLPAKENPPRGALPRSPEVRRALAERQKEMEEERERLREEQRRLEQLRQEIRNDIEAQARLLGNGSDEERSPGATPGMAAKSVAAEDRQTRVKRVSRGMASMTPATAAVALSRLSVPFAAELLSVMDAKRVGKILDAMSPEQAARIMEALVLQGKRGTP